MSLTQMLVEAVSSWIRELGWLGVFGGVMVETVITVIPSPLVPMAAGFFLISPDSDLLTMLIIASTVIGLVGSVAATLGSIAHYAIGYYGGKPLIERYGYLLGLSWEEILSFSSRIKGEREWFTLFLSRALPVIPLSPVSIGAGLIRMDAKRFAAVTLAGTFPRYLVLGIAGYLVGVAYEELVNVLDATETAVAILLIAGVFLYLLVKKRLRNKDKIKGSE